MKTEKEYFNEIEKDWRKSTPRFTERELLEMFPEAKNIIEEKIKELEEIRDIQIKNVKEKLKIVKHNKTDSFSKWFVREFVKISDGEDLIKTENDISRLKRIISTSPNKFPKNWITEKQIQQAMETPIETLIDQPLRKMGKTLVGLCPLHNEKHPSFYIYPETNSCWCFGCCQGGNVINFIRLLKNCSFQEAVKYLIN